MPSKLSFHLSGYPEGIYNLLGKMRPTVVKVYQQSSEMNIRAILDACHPQPYIVYRHSSPRNNYHEPARLFFDELRDTLDKFHKNNLRGLIWEGINEPVVDTPDDARALNAWYMEFAKLMHDVGEMVAGFSWSTGNPDPKKYTWLVPELVTATRAIDVHAFHEYFRSPQHKNQDKYGDWGLYRRFEEALPLDARRPVIITEAGLDDGGNPGDGYIGKLSPEKYLEALQRYDELLLRDQQVLGATIYQCGDWNWYSFELTPLLGALADYVTRAGGGEARRNLWIAAAARRGPVRRSGPQPAAARRGTPVPQTQRIQWGININPAIVPAGRPSAQELQDLGTSWVRFVFDVESITKMDKAQDPLQKAIQFYDSYISELSKAGIQILLVLNNQTLAHWEYRQRDRWPEYTTKFALQCKTIAEKFKSQVKAYEIWNEPDFNNPTPAYDPTVPPEMFWALLERSYHALKGVSPEIQIIAGGLASGQPGWLDDVKQGADRTLYADAVGVHPYGRRPTPGWPNPTWGFGVMEDLLRSYADKVKPAPLWITELGTDDTTNQADFPEMAYNALSDKHFAGIAPVAFWFCWSDGMVSPFGLVDRAGHKKGAYKSFRNATL